MKAVWVSVILAASVGCRIAPRIKETYVPRPDAVAFDIAPAGSQRWAATYTGQGKTAKFIIELGPARSSNSDGFKFSFGQGRFLAVDGSDASTFLAQLKQALEAKQLPANPARVQSLDFQYAGLGENQSKASNGFVSQPAGNWSLMKVFFGDDDSEVFLNMNPVLGKAEFSIKDSDYGDKVLAEFAKVL